MDEWGNHVLKVGSLPNYNAECPSNDSEAIDTEQINQNDELINQYRKDVEPWLSSLFQSEHLSLLVGSGFTTAIAQKCKCQSLDMGYDANWFPQSYRNVLDKHLKENANITRSCKPNIEDQIRILSQSIDGLIALGEKGKAVEFELSLNELLKHFYKRLLDTEAGIRSNMGKEHDINPLNTIVPFLMSFASRAASRERLNLFTTNYDRLIELGCDFSGIRIIDRFIGALEPVFRSSRLDVDMHYSPPGIRGEPRYLEGVVRLTKLHGSLDWRYDKELKVIRRIGIGFGAVQPSDPIFNDESQRIMIYPNPMKDRETAEYPYVELFRDLAAAICRPNSTLVTYGYGFGDDHINRAITDMLTIPSTHLLIISYNKADNRIPAFFDKQKNTNQISLMIGSHFGNITTLVANYLPRPSYDSLTIRMADLKNKRTANGDKESKNTTHLSNQIGTGNALNKLSTTERNTDVDIPF